MPRIREFFYDAHVSIWLLWTGFGVWGMARDVNVELSLPVTPVCAHRNENCQFPVSLARVLLCFICSNKLIMVDECLKLPCQLNRDTNLMIWSPL
jgi:hypothetical protein